MKEQPSREGQDLVCRLDRTLERILEQCAPELLVLHERLILHLSDADSEPPEFATQEGIFFEICLPGSMSFVELLSLVLRCLIIRSLESGSTTSEHDNETRVSTELEGIMSAAKAAGLA